MLAGGMLVIQPIQLDAGNTDRSGEAGATQLLINPWVRSSGWGGANSAGCRGLESMYLNVAGVAFTKKTELLFAHNSWLGKIADININSFGLTQRMGETGVIGLGITSMDLGEIDITTTESPEGGIGKFSPRFTNLNLCYSKAFSDNIYGGMNFKVISETMADLSAKGAALDAGIQYVTGEMGKIKFGISLKNVGPRMKYRGDGLSFSSTVLSTGSGLTAEYRSAQFELPSLVNIGASYDFYFSQDSSAMKDHKLTVAGNFTAFSFGNDQYKLGLEYSLKNLIMLRVGYEMEKGSFKELERTTALTGPSAGFSVELPFSEGKKSTFGLDYSYRATRPFDGVHSVGVRICL